MKKTTTAALSIASLVFASAALGTMEMQKALNAKYPTAKANCASCHTAKMPKKGAADLNAFGKDCKDAKNDYAKIEAKDSDGDGKSNLDELKAGTNPGDPKSK